MAGTVDIDDAFDTLVKRERAAAEWIRADSQSTAKALTVVEVPETASLFNAMVAAREDFLANAAKWNQYAVDQNVMGALCVKIAAFFDAVEAFLPFIASIVGQSYRLIGASAFQEALSSSGKSLEALHAALLLPASELVSFVDFMYAGSIYMPEDVLTLQTFNQVQDVVATVQSLQQLVALEALVHWAGQPNSKLVLCDAFRTQMRDGDLQLVENGGNTVTPVHAWLFTDMCMLAKYDTSSGSGMWGVTQTIPLATCNSKILAGNAGASAGIPEGWFGFGLYTPEATIVLACDEAEDRDGWAADLVRCSSAAATDADSIYSSVATVQAGSATAALTDAAGAAERIRARLATKMGAGSIPNPSPSPPPPATPGPPSMPPPPAQGAPPAAAPQTAAPAMLPPPPQLQPPVLNYSFQPIQPQVAQVAPALVPGPQRPPMPAPTAQLPAPALLPPPPSMGLPQQQQPQIQQQQMQAPQPQMVPGPQRPPLPAASAMPLPPPPQAPIATFAVQQVPQAPAQQVADPARVAQEARDRALRLMQTVAAAAPAQLPPPPPAPAAIGWGQPGAPAAPGMQYGGYPYAPATQQSQQQLQPPVPLPPPTGIPLPPGPAPPPPQPRGYGAPVVPQPPPPQPQQSAYAPAFPPTYPTTTTQQRQQQQQQQYAPAYPVNYGYAPQVPAAPVVQGAPGMMMMPPPPGSLPPPPPSAMSAVPANGYPQAAPYGYGPR